MTGSSWLVVLAALAVVNPPRLAPALRTLAPVRVESTSIRRAPAVGVVTLGAVAAMAVFALLAVASDRLLDSLDVSAPTMRVAAGLVLLLAVLRDLVGGRPSAEPALLGWGAAVVPVLVPFIARPELAILIVSVASVEGVSVAIGALVLMAAVTVGLAALNLGHPAQRVEGAAGLTLSALCAVAGVALAVDGVYGV